MYPQNYTSLSNQIPQNYTPLFNPPPQNMWQAQQIAQSSGFISVASEDVARNYPVAPGNSVTFKNENAPYIYTKTMGFSQLDSPQFDKYKLVKEDIEVEQPAINYVLPSDLEPLIQRIDELEVTVEKLQETTVKQTYTRTKKEEKVDAEHDKHIQNVSK